MRLIIFIFLSMAYSQSSFAACGAAPDGSIEYNTGSSVYRLCNGSTWQTIKLDATNDGACSTSKAIEYDATDKYHKVCVGGNYKPVACVGGTGTCTTYTSCAGTTNGTVNFVSGQGFRWCDGSFWRQMNIDTSGPDTVATKVIISGPTSFVTSTDCAAYSVTLLNTSNEPVAAASSTTINVTDAAVATTTFYTDAACSLGADTTQATFSIAAGATTGYFYYKNTAAGTTTLSADDTGSLTLDTLAVTSAVLTPVICTGTMSSTSNQGTIYDPSGAGGTNYAKASTCQYAINPTAGGRIQLSITELAMANDSLNIYDNTSAAVPHVTGSPWTASPAVPITTYASSGSAYVSFLENNDATRAVGFTITWKAYGATKLAFQTGSSTSVAESACQPYIIERQTAGSVATTSPFSATVSLTSGSTGATYYSNNVCTASITSAVISADATSVTVYYKDEKPGSWTLTATDAGGVFTSGTLGITTTEAVNDAPLAANDSLVTPKDTVLDMTLATALFGNDSDEEGGALSLNAISITSTQGGTIALQGAGVYRYTPPALYIGLDSFTYSIKDPSNAISNTATVSISVGTVMSPTTWTGHQKLKTNDPGGGGFTPTVNETIGNNPQALSASGRMVAFGTEAASSSAGAIYLLRDPDNDGNWTNYVVDRKIQAPTPTANFVYGANLVITGRFLAVSEPKTFASSGTSGTVHIYKDDDGTDWSNVSTTPVASISAASFSRPGANDACGVGLAFYGRVLVIGCPANNDQDTTITTLGDGTRNTSGAVLIVRDTSAGNDWSSYVIDQYLKAPTITAAQRFGARIRFDGTTLVIGSDAGATQTTESVFVYRDANGNGEWNDVTLKGTLTDNLSGTDDAYGEAIALKDNVIAVSARTDDSSGTTDSGAVYIWRDSNGDGNWTDNGGNPQLDAKIYEDTATRANNAWSLAIALKGDSLYVAAPSSTISAVTNRGRVWIYRDPDNNASWTDVTTTAGNANVKAVVDPNAPATGDQFGRSIAVEDVLGFTILFSSAPYEDGASPSTSTGQTSSGAIYSFK